MIESVEARPTDQTVEVFDLLSGQLDDRLKELDRIVGTDVPAFNDLISARGLPPITCASASPD